MDLKCNKDAADKWNQTHATKFDDKTFYKCLSIKATAKGIYFVIDDKDKKPGEFKFQTEVIIYPFGHK